jgi:uncharacterized SAM-binding protein YcdF (DUF218 family)
MLGDENLFSWRLLNKRGDIGSIFHLRRNIEPISLLFEMIPFHLLCSGQLSMKKIYYLIIISLVIISFFLYIFRDVLLMAIGNFLIIQDPLQPADVIHVVSGPDHRTYYSIQLFKQGYGKKLFFTGGWCADIQGIHADRSKDQSMEQGIPEEMIGTDSYQVVSTYQEAERLKLWIDRTHGSVKSVIIVSDPHHMRRARWTYQQVLGKDIQLIMAPVPFDQTPYHQRWWLDRMSINMVRDEYIKTIYYYLRYKFSSGLIKEWLAKFDTE